MIVLKQYHVGRTIEARPDTAYLHVIWHGWEKWVMRADQSIRNVDCEQAELWYERLLDAQVHNSIAEYWEAAFALSDIARKYQIPINALISTCALDWDQAHRR